MKRLVIILIVGFLAWKGYTDYKRHTRAVVEEAADVARPASPPIPQRAPLAAAQFKCDGRLYCSQMTSCEEATFFLRNCPGVLMDGNNDGIPCEKQWCNVGSFVDRKNGTHRPDRPSNRPNRPSS
jgi:hypothetical protein